jgi:uncharacterized protein YbjT (DUF2867 family)
MMQCTILVTAGAGFGRSHVVRAAVDAGTIYARALAPLLLRSLPISLTILL